MNLSESERRLRRRLYWSLLNRDSLCALGLKAPLSCWPQYDAMPDLTVDDFDLGIVPQDGYDSIGVKWPPQKRPLLCQTAVAQTKLHQHLRSIISKQYRLGEYNRSTEKLHDASSKMVLLPLTTQNSRANLEELEIGLLSWRDALPPDLQQVTVESEIPDPNFESYVVLRTVMHMLYHTCLITLFRPWLRPLQVVTSVDTPSDGQAFQHKVQTTVRTSAYTITDLGVGLYQLDLVRHLPQTGLTALVAAVVSHITDMLSSSESHRQAAFHGFERCSHLLEELRDNYYSADHSADFVRILAQAKRFPKKPKMNQGASNSTLQGEMLDAHIDALSSFSAVEHDSVGLIVDQVSPPALSRPLPEALFPEGLGLSAGLSSGTAPPASWDLPIETTEAIADRQEGLGAVEDWAYYRNLREETVRLLGDFYEDPSGLFSTLPELQGVFT